MFLLHWLYLTLSLSSVFVFFFDIFTFEVLSFVFQPTWGLLKSIESVNICFSVNLENVQPLYFKFFFAFKKILSMIPITYKLDWYFPICWLKFCFQSLFSVYFIMTFLQIHCDLFIWCDQFSKSIQIFSNSRIFIWPFDTIIKSRALNKLYQLVGPDLETLSTQMEATAEISAPHILLSSRLLESSSAYIFLYMNLRGYEIITKQ